MDDFNLMNMREFLSDSIIDIAIYSTLAYLNGLN